MSNQAEQTEVDEDVAEELEESSEVEQEEVEQTEAEQTDEPEASESDEVVVSIGDAPPASGDESTAGLPEWVNTMRKSNREKAVELKQALAEIERLKAASAPRAAPVGTKPTLESCDYDADKFEAELTAWHERKRAAEADEKKRNDAAEAEKKAWSERVETYGKQKSALRVNDYEEAEAYALSHLSGNQPQIIVAGADNAAVVLYALSKNPEKLKELSAITDPVKFAFAVAKLETQMKVTTKKAAPLPETRLSGSGRTPISGDKKLAELEAKADKTGDRTELVAYRKSLVKRAA